VWVNFTQPGCTGQHRPGRLTPQEYTNIRVQGSSRCRSGSSGKSRVIFHEFQVSRTIGGTMKALRSASGIDSRFQVCQSLCNCGRVFFFSRLACSAGTSFKRNGRRLCLKYTAQNLWGVRRRASHGPSWRWMERVTVQCSTLATSTEARELHWTRFRRALDLKPEILTFGHSYVGGPS